MLDRESMTAFGAEFGISHMLTRPPLLRSSGGSAAGLNVRAPYDRVRELSVVTHVRDSRGDRHPVIHNVLRLVEPIADTRSTVLDHEPDRRRQRTDRRRTPRALLRHDTQRRPVR